MLNPCIIVPNNILILESALDINLSGDLFVLLFVLSAEFDDLHAVNIAIHFVPDLENLATATLPKE